MLELEQEHSLQTRLRWAVGSLLDGEITAPQLLAALDREICDVERMQQLAPKSRIGSALTGALDSYLDCLVWVEDMIGAGADLDHDCLAEIYSRSSEANQVLDALCEPEDESDSGYLM